MIYVINFLINFGHNLQCIQIAVVSYLWPSLTYFLTVHFIHQL